MNKNNSSAADHTSNILLAYSLGLTIFGLDQLTKLLVEQYMSIPGRRITLIPWLDLLNLFYVQNTGAAWGILPGFRLLFVAVALVVTGGCIWFIHAYPDHLVRFPVALLFGGGLGNLVDRLFRVTGVVDFVDLGIYTYRWPTFNVADLALTVAVFWLAKLILYDEWPVEDE